MWLDALYHERAGKRIVKEQVTQNVTAIYRIYSLMDNFVVGIHKL